jgi:hypothetical protein
MSATFPGPPLLRGSSDVVRTRIAKASIACDHRPAFFERVILAVPIRITRASRDHRAPRSLHAFDVSWTEAYRCKSSGSHQDRAYHHLSTSMQGFVITPRRLSLFQYVVADYLKSDLRAMWFELDQCPDIALGFQCSRAGPLTEPAPGRP